jgi:hypothetical protein
MAGKGNAVLPINAAVVYFAVVFAAGFVLGTIRAIFFVPKIDEEVAVLIELLLMLIISWVTCISIINRFRVPAALAPRLVMGGLAFALMMVAEVGVSVLAFGRTVVEHFETSLNTISLLGLAAQVAFAFLPAIQLGIPWSRRA